MRCLQPPSGEAAAAAARHRAALPVLETARLRLRAPRMEDLPLWTAIWTAPDCHVRMTEERAWEEFCVYAAGWLLHGHGAWALERREDGARVGFVLLGLEWGDAAPEIGWAIAREARGQGYAAEAARAVQAHAAALLGEEAALSYIDAANAASIRVAERVGARRLADFDPTTRVYAHPGADASTPAPQERQP